LPSPGPSGWNRTVDGEGQRLFDCLDGLEPSLKQVCKIHGAKRRHHPAQQTREQQPCTARRCLAKGQIRSIDDALVRRGGRLHDARLLVLFEEEAVEALIDLDIPHMASKLKLLVRILGKRAHRSLEPLVELLSLLGQVSLRASKEPNSLPFVEGQSGPPSPSPADDPG